jgi:ABC-type transport system substrate-binding protein
MAGGYWNSFLERRVSRRRALAATGGSAAAAAFLAACGGSDADDKAPRDVSGLLSQPVDTSEKVVRGGTWPGFIQADVPHFDSIGRYHTGANAQNLYSYSVLVDNKPYNVTEGETYPEWAFDAEGAESWEYSPDGLTLTWKLRNGLKTDPRPPTNGRLYDSGDLEFTFKKFSALSPRKSDILNEANPNAAVVSASFPDACTMVWKLAFPSPVLFQKMNRLLMMTKEGDTALPDGYDPLRTMRGTGPFLLTAYEPSVRVVYEKNPNYWRKDLPAVDRVELLLLSEAAQREAQFRAGRIDAGGPPPERIVQTKQELPNLQLILDPHLPFGNGGGTWMDYRPGSPGWTFGCGGRCRCSSIATCISTPSSMFPATRGTASMLARCAGTAT